MSIDDCNFFVLLTAYRSIKNVEETAPSKAHLAATQHLLEKKMKMRVRSPQRKRVRVSHSGVGEGAGAGGEKDFPTWNIIDDDLNIDVPLNLSLNLESYALLADVEEARFSPQYAIALENCTVTVDPTQCMGGQLDSPFPCSHPRLFTVKVFQHAFKLCDGSEFFLYARVCSLEHLRAVAETIKELVVETITPPLKAKQYELYETAVHEAVTNLQRLTRTPSVPIVPSYLHSPTKQDQFQRDWDLYPLSFKTSICTGFGVPQIDDSQSRQEQEQEKRDLSKDSIMWQWLQNKYGEVSVTCGGLFRTFTSDFKAYVA